MIRRRMTNGIEQTPQLRFLRLPISLDIANRGLEIILRDPMRVIQAEINLIDATNPHISRYISDMSKQISNFSIFYAFDYLDGAAFAHLIIRLQQQKANRVLLVSHAHSIPLPKVTEEIIRDHYEDVQATLRELNGDRYGYAVKRSNLLNDIEPALSQTVIKYAQATLGEIPIPSTIQSDEYGTIPNFILPGAADLYFVVSRALPKN